MLARDSQGLMLFWKSLILHWLWVTFWSHWNLHAQKQKFLGVSENCFIFESILGIFWYPRMGIKIDEKSILGVILRQDGSKEGASPSQHGSKDLLFMDLSSILVCFWSSFHLGLYNTRRFSQDLFSPRDTFFKAKPKTSINITQKANKNTTAEVFQLNQTVRGCGDDTPHGVFYKETKDTV